MSQQVVQIVNRTKGKNNNNFENSYRAGILYIDYLPISTQSGLITRARNPVIIGSR